VTAAKPPAIVRARETVLAILCVLVLLGTVVGCVRLVWP